MKDSLQLDNRAAEARAILNSSLFQETMDAMEDEFTARMRNASVGSPAASEAHAMLKVIDEFKSRLRSVITDQKIATHGKVGYGR